MTSEENTARLLRKKLNRRAWCKERGKLHERNRELAKERRKGKEMLNTSLPMA